MVKKALLVLSALVLLGCSDRSGDPDACRVFGEVDEQIAAYEPGQASADEIERNRQWEFRLAQASVMANDHDLSLALRSIAYVASAAPEGTEADKAAFLEKAAPIRDMCD